MPHDIQSLARARLDTVGDLKKAVAALEPFFLEAEQPSHRQSRGGVVARPRRSRRPPLPPGDAEATCKELTRRVP